MSSTNENATKGYKQALTAWEMFLALAEQLGGDAATGNFKGTIRLEPGENGDIQAETFYDVIKRYCHTASISQKVRKDGGVSLRIVAGARIEKAAEMDAGMNEFWRTGLTNLPIAA